MSGPPSSSSWEPLITSRDRAASLASVPHSDALYDILRPDNIVGLLVNYLIIHTLSLLLLSLYIYYTYHYRNALVLSMSTTFICMPSLIC